MEAKLLTLRDYSLSYNQLFSEKTVIRNFLLDEIEELTSNEAKLVIVEGGEEIGKTTLLLQFADRHRADCLAYFINPASRSSYKQDYLIEDLGRQLLFLNTSEAPDDDLSITEGVFNKLVFDLIKAPNRKKKPIFIVLDGLDQIDKADIELLKPTLHSLPWATNYFYFVVSGDKDKLRDILPETALNKAKTVRVIRFTQDETQEFFQPKDEAERELIKEIYEIWKGHPERLSQVKRILESGINIQDFLLKDDLHEKNDLLEIEWNQSIVRDLEFEDDIVKLVSIISLDDNTRDLFRISDIIKGDENELRKSINEISFLTIKNNEVSFVSPSYRKFVSKKLQRYANRVSSILIEYYTEKEGIDSIINLPTLFEKSQMWANIVDLLTINNLGLIITKSQSFADINRQINYGFKASNNLKKAYSDVLKFALYRSSIKGLQKSDSREAQIEAYIALDQQDEAFSLISNAVLKEDRLKMLIGFIKECRIRKKEVANEVVEEVKDLLVDIDSDYLRENIIDLIVGLAHFLPDKAVQLIEKISGNQSGNGSVEWLLGYVAMIINKSKSDDSIKTISEKEDNKVNEFIEKFSKSIGFGVNDIDENEIIENVSKVENISDRLFLVREWIKKNKKASNIHSIIDHAIGLMLQSSSVSKPTTTILLDIISPLEQIPDKELAESLILRVEELMVSINNPTVDKIKLNLLIIRTLVNFNPSVANTKLEQLYSSIESISDYTLKVEGFSHCWALMKDLTDNLSVNNNDFLLDEEYIKSDIIKSVEYLLNSTSDHYTEIENSIEVIAKKDIDFALTISKMLNTIYRRHYATLKCVATYVEGEIENWNETKIIDAINSISNDNVYTKAVIIVFDSAFEQKEQAVYHRSIIKNLLPLINNTTGNSVKCYLLTKAILLLNSKPSDYPGLLFKYDKLIEKLRKFQLDFWNKVESPWEKITVGYKMCSELAEYDKSLAYEYFSKARLQAQECIIDNRTHASAYINSIRLMIRVFVGLLNKDKDYSYDKISTLISHIPSDIDKVELWSELSVRSSLVGAKNVANDIVSKKIVPIVNQYSTGKEQVYFIYLLKTCAAAIHLSQPATLKLYIEQLSTDKKEDIISSVCYVILTKCHDSDPYDDNIGSSQFNYQDASEYLELINQIDSDDSLFFHIRNLCYIGKNYSSNFVREQKIEIRQKLNTIIASKFPNTLTGVSHIGYAIVSEACAYHFSLDHPNTQANQQFFKDLGERVNSVPNVADKSYIYSILATECNHKKQKVEFLKIAFDEADKILSVREKINLYEIVLETALKFAPDVFNDRIKKIQEEVYKLDESEMFPTFRKLIDLAFKHDKQLAHKLISSLDTDPGRKKLSNPATDHIEKLELEKLVFQDYSQINKVKDRKQMGNIAWKMLGQLNANKRTSRELDQTIAIVRSASKAPYMYTAPLFEFFLQNAIRHSDSSKSLLLNLYESTYSNAELCYQLICSISNKSTQAQAYSSIDSDNVYIIKPGFRKEAIDFIGKNMKVSGSSDIYIIDPYFSEKDIDFIKNITEWCYGSSITVLTSCEASGDFTRFSYRSAWDSISSEEPPQSFYVKVTNLSKNSSANVKSPIHDRWILMYDKQQGLNLGNSINSMGINKASRIATIDCDEVKSVYDEFIVPLIKNRVREFAGNKVSYETFDM